MPRHFRLYSSLCCLMLWLGCYVLHIYLYKRLPEYSDSANLYLTALLHTGGLALAFFLTLFGRWASALVFLCAFLPTLVLSVYTRTVSPCVWSSLYALSCLGLYWVALLLGAGYRRLPELWQKLTRYGLCGLPIFILIYTCIILYFFASPEESCDGRTVTYLLRVLPLFIIPSCICLSICAKRGASRILSATAGLLLWLPTAVLYINTCGHESYGDFPVLWALTFFLCGLLPDILPGNRGQERPLAHVFGLVCYAFCLPALEWLSIALRPLHYAFPAING